MNRATATLAAVILATGTAPSAAADPVVPQLRNDAVPGAPCFTTVRFVFGTDAAGAFYSCGSPGKPGVWVPLTALLGTRDIGATGCVGEVLTVSPDGNGWTAAQSPEGVPLFCAYPTDTWEVHPTS
jgi:hypothetical protein